MGAMTVVDASQLFQSRFEKDLTGRVALVTGGGRGIGRAVSLALAAGGAAVALTFRRDGEAAASVVAQIEAGGGRAIAYHSSVDVETDNDRVVADVAAAFGYVDILVNNAGVASRGNSVADTDTAEVARLLATHAAGPHQLCRLVIPPMRQRPRGDIIFVSSMAAANLRANGAPYNMAKAAMEALATTLSKEEHRHNIHVNVVAPGIVETDMGTRLLRARGLSAENMPFGRLCQPADVALVVRFLVSEVAGYVNGARIRLDGGDS